MRYPAQLREQQRENEQESGEQHGEHGAHYSELPYSLQYYDGTPYKIDSRMHRCKGLKLNKLSPMLLTSC